MRLFLEDPDARARAAGALGAYGDAATPAIPDLADCAVHDERAPALACARALARIGEASLPSLSYMVGLTHEVKLRAIEALSRMGEAGAPLLSRAYLDSCAALAGGELDEGARAIHARARARAEEALAGSDVLERCRAA